MPSAYLVSEKVLVIRDGKFYEYVVIDAEQISHIGTDATHAALTFKGAAIEKAFKGSSVSAEDIAFVLIDPSLQDVASQIVGVAELDNFDESQPGKVHFFK
jgi:hypothetical protein